MLVPRLRSRVSPLISRVASRLPPHPNLYTLLGLLATLLGAAAVLYGRLAEGIVLVALGGLLDALDGAVARAYNMVSKAGGFLDSLCDRISDAAVTYSFSVFAPSTLIAYLIAVTLVYSYARARAEAAACSRMEGVGFLERGERLPLQLAILVLYAVGGSLPALYLLYAYAAAATVALVHRSLALYRVLARMG